MEVKNIQNPETIAKLKELGFQEKTGYCYRDLNALVWYNPDDISNKRKAPLIAIFINGATPGLVVSHMSGSFLWRYIPDVLLKMFELNLLTKSEK